MDNDFELDTSKREQTLKVRARGRKILANPILNWGTAFTREQREALGISGLLPPAVTNLERQVRRSYAQYSRYQTPLSKSIFLSDLRARNDVLFYALLTDHIEEMLPIVYTPTIGEVIERFSSEYHGARAVFCSIDSPELIEQNLLDFGLGADDVDLVVVTDSAGILGIGDQGVGGVQIAIGKCSVYTAAAGIHPRRTLPVVLDVGTNNLGLLSSNMYLGEQHPRVTGERYDQFIDTFVNAVGKLFPHALLHWEDFGADTAHVLLNRYKETHCTFNDDIQGTASVVLAAVMAAVKITGKRLADQRIVVYGLGTAGAGVADIIREGMRRDGISDAEALSRFWTFNSRGLIMEGSKKVRDFQAPYARRAEDISDWELERPGKASLLEVVRNVRPTILLGSSARAGAFTEEIVRTMAESCERPIIMPLSNPTSRLEADPLELLKWTSGKALIATGSPFGQIEFEGHNYHIAQANNALIFPGLGLGVAVSQARRVTDGMIYAAADALASLVNEYRTGVAVLPSINDLRLVSASVAVAVAKAATAESVAANPCPDVVDAVFQRMWCPVYPELEIIDPE
ncbi:MAG: NAD-dependent malic enzyme [Propionibacteriaceae bacterium]|nr:NAD-dependent malic enzyme [Propionibacteriaceae bacterium]